MKAHIIVQFKKHWKWIFKFHPKTQLQYMHIDVKAVADVHFANEDTLYFIRFYYLC
jgi:hypothetical protein